jgi:hypothetical protein
MAYFFIILGVVLVIAAARDTQGDLFTLLQGDLIPNSGTSVSANGSVTNTFKLPGTNSANFFYWIIAIGLIGAVGYVDDLKPISNGFLALVIVVLLLDNRGFFTQFSAALNQISGTVGTPIGNATSPGVSVAVDTVPTGTSVSNSSTTVVAGGTTVVSGGSGNGGGPSSGQCPAGYEWLDSQCVPINFFGGGGDPFGGSTGPSDPFDPFGGVFTS